MPDHAGYAQTTLWHHAVLVKVAAMKVRVGDDGAAGHFVKSNVLGCEVGRAGHHHRMGHARGVAQSPGDGLHTAQAAAHHRGKLFNTQAVQQAGLRIHPVFYRDHWEVCAIHRAGGRIGVRVHGPGRAKARAQVVHADDKEAVGVHRFARADHAVPPALGLVLPRIDTRHMVRGVECMANQHRVGAFGIQRAVGLKTQ